jgi:hypothetical protein
LDTFYPTLSNSLVQEKLYLFQPLYLNFLYQRVMLFLWEYGIAFAIPLCNTSNLLTLKQQAAFSKTHRLGKTKNKRRCCHEKINHYLWNHIT